MTNLTGVVVQVSESRRKRRRRFQRQSRHSQMHHVPLHCLFPLSYSSNPGVSKMAYLTGRAVQIRPPRHLRHHRGWSGSSRCWPVSERASECSLPVDIYASLTGNGVYTQTLSVRLYTVSVYGVSVYGVSCREMLVVHTAADSILGPLCRRSRSDHLTPISISR